MVDAFARVGQWPVLSATIHVPWSGAWFAEVVFEQAADVSGAVVLSVGDVELRGTIDPRFNGTRGNQRMCRIAAGAGSWGASVAPRAYVNDQGVTALLVAQDAARAVGETLGAFTPGASTVGTAYVRPAGTAAQALEDAAGGASWWVEFDGTTTVGTRATSTPNADAYELLDFDPDQNIATIAADSLSTIVVGSILSERLDAPQTVRDLEIVVTPDATRIKAWCGTPVRSRGRLEGALRAIVARATDDRLFGCYRYRAIRMVADRVELQAVDSSLGLPDLGPTSMWSGVSGAHVTLTPGVEVLVQFIDGKRSKPAIVGYVGKGGPSFAPVTIDFGDSPTDFVALASKVLSELQAIRTWANGHTHPFVATGAASPTSTPTAPMSAPGSVASTLVRSK